MSIYSVIAIGYFLIGFIMMRIWWRKKYKKDYEAEKDNEVEKPMIVLLLAILVVFWPLKLC
jgi:hypothetical protein